MLFNILFNIRVSQFGETIFFEKYQKDRFDVT